jgi:DNA-binding MarR family transcriptional regulator
MTRRPVPPLAAPRATAAATKPVTGPKSGVSHRAAVVAAAATDWLALDHQLCFALYAASLAMTKAYKPVLTPLDLTYPQYLVMLVLWEAESSPAALAGRSACADTNTTGTTGTTSMTVSQLGARLTLDSGTLTPLLKRLEAQGRLQRLRDLTAERRVRLQLTPAGLALKAQAQAIPQAIACATACDLQQIGHLAAQLTALRQQLQMSSSGAATAA